MTLTPKQQRFVEEYMIDLNATQAAIRAGYSEKTAQEQSSRLLSNVMVSEAIEAARSNVSTRTEVTIDRVLQEMARLGFSDLRNVITAAGHLKFPTEWDDATAAAVSSIKVITRPTGERDEDDRPIIEHIHEIKLWDKNSALDKIAKHLGMFIERHSVEMTMSYEDRLKEFLSDRQKG